MRELIYLSERKLRQFMNVRRPRWWHRLTLEGRLTIPFVGSARVSRSPESPFEPRSNLDAIIAEIEGGERATRWFTDKTLTAGQWIQFEAPMNYSSVKDKYFGSVVLFADTGSQFAGYSSEGVRLLLHGSSEHLAGSVATNRRNVTPGAVLDQSVPVRDDSGSDVAYIYHIARKGYIFELGRAGEVFSQLSAALTQGEDMILEKGGHNVLYEHMEMDFATALQMTVHILDQFFIPETAAWMKGRARVTAVIEESSNDPKVVVATPLYVEYSTPPV